MVNRMNKRFKWPLAFLLIVAAFCGQLYWDNHTVGVTNYTVSSREIPNAFDGYRILLIADIQGSSFGEENQRLIEKIEAQQADMVVFAGDLIDTGVPGSVDVIDHLLASCELPPKVYAVSGNHDKWSGMFEKLKDRWEREFDIRFLENDSVSIQKDGEKLFLHGIADPETWDGCEAAAYVENVLGQLKIQEGYHILLFHRANMLDQFLEQPFDLILSGHMHGGQIRLPFVGGLKSPHGDWFPDYDGGKYQRNGHTYIVSRGIGNAVKVPRFWNRGEIVVVTLQSEP